MSMHLDNFHGNPACNIHWVWVKPSVTLVAELVTCGSCKRIVKREIKEAMLELRESYLQAQPTKEQG